MTTERTSTICTYDQVVIEARMKRKSRTLNAYSSHRHRLYASDNDYDDEMATEENPNTGAAAPTTRRRRTLSDESQLIDHPPIDLNRRGSLPVLTTLNRLKEQTPLTFRQILAKFEEDDLFEAESTTTTTTATTGQQRQQQHPNRCPTARRRRSADRHNSDDDRDFVNRHVINIRSNRFHITESMDVVWLPGENFCVEFPFLDSSSSSSISDGSDDNDNIDDDGNTNRDRWLNSGEYGDRRSKSKRVRFSRSPIKVYSTHGADQYDRRNMEIDTVGAKSVYELERRLESMELLDVEIVKDDQNRLGVDIVGMSLETDVHQEKLSIFVKSVTPDGPADRDGRIHVWDQIIEVDGESLVGVSQTYAVYLLRNTRGVVRLRIARDRDVDHCEIAELVRAQSNS